MWLPRIKNINAIHLIFINIVLVIAIIGGPVRAGIILQDQHNGSFQILAFSPIGQTFTAENSQIDSIAFFFEDYNPWYSNGITTMRLFEGLGIDGTLLETASTIIIPGTYEYVNFDFSSVILSIGDIYTAIIERPNPRWGVQSNQHSYPNGMPISGRTDYIGGDRFFEGTVQSFADLRFRILPLSTVPEPNTIVIILTGLLVLFARKGLTLIWVNSSN